MKSRANPPTDQAGDAGSPGSHASASAGQAPIELLAFTDGLRAGHVRQTPLLEKVATIPAREHGMPPTRAASRVYGDGAYYLAQVSHDDVSPHWAYLSSLRPDGMARLQALLAEACGTSARVQSDDTGSVSYVVRAPGCARSFRVGLPSAQSRLLEADGIINSSLQPIPRSP